MTVTQELQKYTDEIYGDGFYKVEYVTFKGFYARSLSADVQPHSQFLGSNQNQAHAHLDEMDELAKARTIDDKLTWLENKIGPLHEGDPAPFYPIDLSA